MDKRDDGKRGEMHLVGRRITDGRRQEDTDWIKAYGRGGGGVLQELTAAVSASLASLRVIARRGSLSGARS